MKTKIIVIACVLCVVLVSTASARRGMGFGDGYYAAPRMAGYAHQQIDAETQEKLNIFYTETREIRKQLMMKQSERQALVMATEVDPAAVAKISGELFDLMTVMQEKAQDAGLANYMGGPSYGRGIMGGGRGLMYGCRIR